MPMSFSSLLLQMYEEVVLAILVVCLNLSGLCFLYFPIIWLMYTDPITRTPWTEHEHKESYSVIKAKSLSVIKIPEPDKDKEVDGETCGHEMFSRSDQELYNELKEEENELFEHEVLGGDTNLSKKRISGKKSSRKATRKKNILVRMLIIVLFCGLALLFD